MFRKFKDQKSTSTRTLKGVLAQDVHTEGDRSYLRGVLTSFEGMLSDFEESRIRTILSVSKPCSEAAAVASAA